MGTEINIKIDFPFAFPIIPSFVLLDIVVVLVVLVVLVVSFYHASEENVYLEREMRRCCAFSYMDIMIKGK